MGRKKKDDESALDLGGQILDVLSSLECSVHKEVENGHFAIIVADEPGHDSTPLIEIALKSIDGAKLVNFRRITRRRINGKIEQFYGATFE